jgi:hypothetical protein
MRVDTQVKYMRFFIFYFFLWESGAVGVGVWGVLIW